MIKFLPLADHVNLKLSHEFVVKEQSVRIRVYHDGYVVLDAIPNLNEISASSVILHVVNTYDRDMRFMELGSPKKFYQRTGILAGTVAKYAKRAIIDEFSKHKHWRKVFTDYSHKSGRSKSKLTYGALDVITDYEVEKFCDRAVQRT